MPETLTRCDGCDFATANASELSPVGIIKAGHYCGTCAPHARSYLTEKRAASKRMTALWFDEATRLSEIWRKYIRTLPDA